MTNLALNIRIRACTYYREKATKVYKNHLVTTNGICNKYVWTFYLLFLLLISCRYATAQTVVLDSSVGMRGACPGEMVTYTCAVNQGFLLDWIVEPFLPASARIQFTSNMSIESRLDCNSVASVRCEDIQFVATLTNTVNRTVVMTTTLADMTSTLAFTATARLNGTVVQCRGSTAAGFPMVNRTLSVAGLPSPPRTPSYTVQQYGRDNVTLTLQWQPPQYDGGAPVNYTITVSSGLSPVTTSGTSVTVTVPYNVNHTVSIVATNCNGNSSVAMVTIPIVANCSDPTPPMDGSIAPYQNTTEGAEISFICNPGFIPAEDMTAMCAADGRWSPDPAGHRCTFDCGVPGNPQHGSLESNTGTTEGSVVFYSCDQHLVPEGRMMANCTRNGWSPNPEDLNCTEVNCGMPYAPVNGSIENMQNINTTGGARIVFRCNESFVPAGRMSATCTPSNASWTPNPADLVCIASLIVCGGPTLATGVAVVQPHSNAVNSEIVYQCEESGFVPSSNSSLCREDRMWSPDPSQVECRMMTTTPEVTPTPSGLSGGAVAAIVIVLLLVVVLAVAVVIVVLWLRKRSDVPPKPPPESDDVAMYSVVEGPEKPAPYTGYMHQGPGTEAEYTAVSDIPAAQSKAAEVHYDLPPGSNHPEGLVYASVDIKPKKPSVYHPKEDDRVEYAAIAYQPKDAAKKSQAAAATTAPKTKRYENADELINLDNLLIQLRDVTPMWFDLGDALDLPPSILDDIRGQFETNPEQCMIEMVDAWLQRHLSRGSPTWTEVAEALRKINQNGLADALESVYYTGDLPISVNMTEIPESVFQEGGGTPPPIPIRGTLTDDVEPAPPKPPKSWGTPEKKAPPQHPPRGGSGRRPPPRPPKPSAP